MGQQNAPAKKREYQAIGEPHHSFVACQECFAVVVHGDMAAHDEWHDKLVRDVQMASVAFPVGFLK